MDTNATSLRYLEIVIDDILIHILITETNKYASKELAKLSKNSYSKSKKWTDVSEVEMRIFINILLLQSVINLPEQEWYWSKHKFIFQFFQRSGLETDL